jgi:prevent-host-death family protein
MKKVSIMEAQHNLSKVMKTVEEGGAVYITRRKKVVAKLVPATPESPVQFPDFKTRAARSLQGEWTGTSSSSLLDQTRGDR